MKTRHGAPWWVIVSDFALINLSIFLAYWVRYELQWFRNISYHHPPSAYIFSSVLFTVLMMLTFLADRVYARWQRQPWLDQAYRIVNATAKSVVVVLAATFVLQPLEYSRLLVIEAGIIMVVLLTSSRVVYRRIMNALRARGFGPARVIIAGAGEAGRTVMRTIVARPRLGYQIVGFVDDNPEKGHSDMGRLKALGPISNLPRLIEREAVDEVIITLPWTCHRKIMSIVRECQRRHIDARIVPDMFQMTLSQVDIDDLGGVPLISVREVGFSKSALVIKRGIDIVGAVLGLTIGAPLLALIALAIRLDSPGPVVFHQTRVGLGGRLFEMYKFRSMREGAEEELEELRDLNESDGPTFKMRHDPRTTRVGKFLRRTSLDELPQLLNVLCGEMSLVGPRPPLPAEVERYAEWHKKRLEAPPGMTGLWQVSGRSLLSFDEAVLLDLHYVENWSLWLDLQILLRTIPQVLLGDGAY